MGLNKHKIDNYILPPIFIVGAPRSGTLLAARIIGGYSEHYLITEHTNKRRHVPEEQFDQSESMLWHQNFKFIKSGKTNEIIAETPTHNIRGIKRMRRLYLSFAGNKRLVVKNPQNLIRVSFIKEIFPDALFVFCVRDPWRVIGSATKKGHFGFLLKSINNYKLPNDLLLKVATSWNEAINIYLKEKTENWIILKYDQLIQNPTDTIKKLFEFLRINSESYYQEAILKPKLKKHNYYMVKKLFRQSNRKKEIKKLLKPGCRLFSYDPPSVHTLKENKINHYCFYCYTKCKRFYRRIINVIKRVIPPKIKRRIKKIIITIKNRGA